MRGASVIGDLSFQSVFLQNVFCRSFGVRFMGTLCEKHCFFSTDIRHMGRLFVDSIAILSLRKHPSLALQKLKLIEINCECHSHELGISHLETL